MSLLIHSYGTETSRDWQPSTVSLKGHTGSLGDIFRYTSSGIPIKHVYLLPSHSLVDLTLPDTTGGQDLFDATVQLPGKVWG